MSDNPTQVISDRDAALSWIDDLKFLEERVITDPESGDWYQILTVLLRASDMSIEFVYQELEYEDGSALTYTAPIVDLFSGKWHLDTKGGSDESSR